MDQVVLSVGLYTNAYYALCSIVHIRYSIMDVKISNSLKRCIDRDELSSSVQNFLLEFDA